MSAKCNKVKNPCKICLAAVSQKTGLQCQGACQCWVHYSCLNYTPGKIKDIKAGVIKVTCPCPDCKTSLPREFRTDIPYSCNNSMCPANRPPKCDNEACPTNANGPGRGGGPGAAPIPPPCPLNKCGPDCKQYSSPNIPDPNGPSPPFPPLQPCAPPDPYAGQTSSDACLSKNPRCTSGCSSTNDVSGDFRFNQQRGVGVGGGMPGGGMPGAGMPSFHVVEQMCNTVGELSNQLKALMNQMKQGGYDDGGRGGRGPPGPTGGPPQKSCPKPCYCPGNPGRRM